MEIILIIIYIDETNVTNSTSIDAVLLV